MKTISIICLATGAGALMKTSGVGPGRPGVILRAGLKTAPSPGTAKTVRPPTDSPLPPKKAIDDVSEDEEQAVRAAVAASAATVEAPETESKPFFDTGGEKWSTFGAETSSDYLTLGKCESLKTPLRTYEPAVEAPAVPGKRYATSMDLIGNTPLVDITAVCKPKNPNTVVLGKVEFFNPGYSMKDRIMKNIFDKAEAEGKLEPGMTVVAASSGNTGCSVAMMCAIRGYEAVVITNEKCSEEKKAAIRAYGAELLISKPGQCYMQMETDLAEANPTWFSVDQYNNLDNPNGHYKSSGPEIYAQTAGEVTHFVAAGSTGGTISGIGSFLKERNPDVAVVLADPTGSVFKNYYKTGELEAPVPFLVEGVGKDNIPGAMDFGVVDAVVDVDDKAALRMCATIARKTGLCVGGSSGLNVEACARIAENSDEPLTIVTMLCDSGVKYLSKIFNDDWLREHDIEL